MGGQEITENISGNDPYRGGPARRDVIFGDKILNANSRQRPKMGTSRLKMSMQSPARSRKEE